MKIVRLKSDEFENLVSKHQLDNFYQTTNYGNLMEKFGFKAEYIGFVDNGYLVGGSLILSRPIFMGFKYGYAPHGLIIDYTDKQIIYGLVKKLKSYLFKNSYLLLKIDPLIIKSIRDKDGNVLESENNIEEIMNILKKCGFNHCGFNNYMEAIKPRWHAILNMKNKDSQSLLSNLDKNVRNKIRKAYKYGIEIYKEPESDVSLIYDYIKDMGNYSINYYKYFKDFFGDKFELYIARINTEVYVENSKYLYEKEYEANEKLNNTIQNDGYKGKDMRGVLNKKMESDRILASYKKHLVEATELLKEYPDNLIIGGAIVINHNNKLYFLIEGYDDRYNNLCPGYITKWRIIEKYLGTEIKLFDLNAISGDFKNENNEYKGLNEAKLGYKADAYEYIGEFNLIVNSAMYSLYRNTSDKYNIKSQKK